jgi:hypothetical protein
MRESSSNGADANERVTMKTARSNYNCLALKRLARSKWLRAALLAVGTLFSGPLAAQDFGIDWFATAGGGGDSSGGDFELTATIGQPDPGDLLGGDFSITGGFWSILTILATPGGPSLSVSLAQGNLIISWPDSGSAGFFPEATDALADPSTWVPVNATVQTSNGVNSISLPLGAGNRFYRLRKP